jgi:two-component system sensor histidine kinase UhpB
MVVAQNLIDKKRVLLLVEDNLGDAELITELLTSDASNEQILRATTLKEAEDSLRENMIDAVFLDLQLPDGSGLECVNSVRSWAKDIPIIVLTGLDDTLALSCLSAGAQDYISKQDMRTRNLHRAVGYAIARTQEMLERKRADALQERLAAIVEASNDAIVSSTPEGLITSWNKGATRIFGYSSAEAIGRPAAEIMRPADETSTIEQERRIARTRQGRAPEIAEELVRLRKDNTPITLSVVSFSLRNAAGEVVGLAAICRDVTEAKRRDEELLKRNQELIVRDQQMRALTVHLNNIREEERTRISRDVHDKLGQLLTGLKMDLRWISRRLSPDTIPTEAPIATRLTEAERLVDSTLETIQQIALELRPSALDALGLPSAIRDEARRFERRFGVSVDVQIHVSSRPDPEIATALFRILQELLTNIARHAHASSVNILLEDTSEMWILSVEDDGVGLQGNEARPSSLGLLGMKERAEALRGTVKLEGRQPGTIALVRIPKKGA